MSNDVVLAAIRNGFLFGKIMENERTPQFEIREASPGDAVKTRKMQAESWLATYPNDENGVSYQWVKERTDGWLTADRLEESKSIFAKVISDPTQFYRLATAGDRVVGFVHAKTNDDSTKELEAIYTDPETFGSGLAQRLMHRADQWLDGVETTLAVASYNVRAIRFYEKNGFKVMDNPIIMFKDKIPLIKMLREERKS